MTSQSSYHRNEPHSRSFYPPIASISSSDSGQLYGPTRERGGPSLDFPPQPVEIEVGLVSSSRTLPSPSSSGSNVWDPVFPPHGFGEGSFETSNTARVQQIPLDGRSRAPPPDPLMLWYSTNDGPWIPKDIAHVTAEERTQARQTGNRSILSYGTYRQPNPSDAGSAHYGVPHSDSGYGTRRSVGNTSVFSADVPERDQDCQSLAGHVENYQPFSGYNDTLPARDNRTNESWTATALTTASIDAPNLVCPTCHKTVKTQSELKKHDLRHRKPFKCQVPGCSRKEGFSTTNDLDRHTKSKHPTALRESAPTKKYRCHAQGCKSKDKTWPRLDNFRSHLKRVHGHQLSKEADFEEMIRRAEFWENTNMEIDRDVYFPQRPSFEDSPRPAGPAVHEMVTNTPETSLNWKPAYPNVIDPPEDSLAPKSPGCKSPELDKLDSKAVPQEEKAPMPQVSRRDTVKPLEVFHIPAGVSENKFLESVLAPMSQTESGSKAADSQPPKLSSKLCASGKAVRQNEASSSDAALTEAIRTVLSGSSSDVSIQDSGRISLPSGKMLGNSWNAGTNSAMPAKGQSHFINLVDSPSPGSDSDDSQALQKAEEILKTFRDLGYTLRKEPSLSPKPQNPGSAASNQSHNRVVCQTCKKFIGRPCELKKHMKRHERPYGCTFLTCNKTFGSKNDWKRHENSQHFQAETWRCDEERQDGGVCAKHPSSSSEEATKEKLETCRIGRNCQARFWCGFCVKLVDLKKKSLEAWTERYDHIDDHFMGRHGLRKQGICDWIPVDGSDKPKGGSDSGSPTNTTMMDSPGKESPDSRCGSESERSGSGDPCGVSSDANVAATVGGGSPADAAISLLEQGNRPDSPKRKRSSGSDQLEGRPPKVPKTVGPAKKVEQVVHCCRCNVAHNPKFNQSCTTCNDGHVFCEYCEKVNKVFEGV